VNCGGLDTQRVSVKAERHTRAIFLKLGRLNHPLQNQRVRAVTAYWRNRAQAIPQAA